MSTNPYHPDNLESSRDRVNPYGQNPASIPSVRITPSSSMEEIHAAIRAELEPLGEILSVSDESPFSGKFGAPGTLTSRPPGIKVKIRFRHWSKPMNVFVNWNPTLNRFEYCNRMQRQIALRPQEANPESQEVFARLQKANDVVGGSMKTRNARWGMEHLVVGTILSFLGWMFLTMFVHKVLGVTVEDQPIFAIVAACFTALLSVLCVILALKGKEPEIQPRCWPDMSYADLSRKQWNKNPFGIVETLFRDEAEKLRFLNDLEACAATAGIHYLGTLRTHELLQNGKVSGIIEGEMIFPAPWMKHPCFIFDGEVNGEGDQQKVAWDGERFFYTIQMNETTMRNHLGRFGVSPEVASGVRRRRRHIENINIVDVAQMAAIIHIAPPSPTELFPS